MNDDGDVGALETVEFLARSTCRLRILETLLDRGATSWSDLREGCSVVRTTLQRNLDALVRQGLIRREGRTYHITAAGAQLTERLVAARRTARLADRLSPVLERLPPREFDFGLERLADATLVVATTVNPFAPAQHHMDAVETADHLRVVVPATGADPMGRALESMPAEATHEIVLHERVLEDDEAAAAFREAVARNGESERAVTVYRGEIPYYLGILDGVVQLGVHDDNGVPSALLETDDERVRTWAAGRFESYRAEATPL